MDGIVRVYLYEIFSPGPEESRSSQQLKSRLAAGTTARRIPAGAPAGTVAIRALDSGLNLATELGASPCYQQWWKYCAGRWNEAEV